MTRRPLLFVVLALVSTAAYANNLDEIRRLDREISVATWAGDAVWFEENLLDEYVFITAGGTARNKREVILDLATPGLKIEPYEPADVQVRLYGDAAVVTGRVSQRVTLGGVSYASNIRYTNIYVKRKNRWLLASGHASPIAPRR
jgi:ketosteroid isomerase-like protein